MSMKGVKALESWVSAIDKGEMAAITTILPTETAKDFNLHSERMFMDQKRQIGTLKSITLEKQVTQIIRKKFQEKMPRSEKVICEIETDKKIHMFIDIFIPPLEIMIFGAGHDAIPLATFSEGLGFKTTIVDTRTTYNNEQRFPYANRVVTPVTQLEKVQISAHTYIVVMNHHIKKDEQTLAFVLKSDSPYIGVLGPRSRRERMLQSLKEQGVYFANKEIRKMHSPVGLDIGARTPEEIAISILSEIIAIKNGHKAGFLKGAKAIHSSD